MLTFPCNCTLGELSNHVGTELAEMLRVSCFSRLLAFGFIQFIAQRNLSAI
ncbi:hypothetical protein SAMN05444359_10667 [Neolewinella agarilytica]|uniref:Uncharacterized protein n=1 Tax=Neolewinella agarilytica TaxID=478744 RepID=A0A1H9DMX5_9BACT|nr:hypothetical protein SAMN05444359_10667 [Neolewinella agarilytica]